MSKVIFITGASKGFGRIWAEALLQNGHKVVATARNPETLSSLSEKYRDAVLPLELNVTDRAACFAQVEKARQHFGRIDVLISNAGYGHFGYIEEITEQQAREQIETNLFGSLWCIQAVIPLMRGQNSGHIIQVSSIGGVVAFPSLGIYHGSKWAMEGICESLGQEMSLFGVKVTLVEPGGYATDWAGPSAMHSEPIQSYQPIRDAMKKRASDPAMPGNPDATADAMLQLVNAENPPLRLLLGSVPFHIIEPVYAQRIETWKSWLPVSEKAQK